MATVASTLKMFDAFSKPLQNISQALNMTISAMEQLQSTTNRNTDIAKTFQAAKMKIADAEGEIKEAIDKSNAAQQKFNRSLQDGVSKSRSIADSVKGFLAAYLGFETGRRLGQSMIGGAMDQQQIVDTISARAGDEALGRSIYTQVAQQALKYRQDVDAALAGTMSYMSNTMDPGQLVELNQIAMRLQKLNPTEGLEGAAFSLKELMSGDYTSIAERFNISRSALKDSEARIAGMNGDIEGFIKGMDELLNTQNMTQEAFERMLDSPAAKWDGIIESFRFKMAETGQMALQAFMPIIEVLSNAFQSGQLQGFFNALQIGLYLVVEAIGLIIAATLWLNDLFVVVWPYIGPIIIGVAGALATYHGILLVVTAAQKTYAGVMAAYRFALLLATAAQTGLNLAMLKNPIVWIIGLIVGLVLVMLTLIATLEPVRMFFANTFRAIGEVIAGFVGFALDAIQTFINFFIDAINIFLDGVNKVINAVGSFLGLEAEVNLELKKVDFSGVKSNVQQGIKDTFGAVADATEQFNIDNLKKKLGIEQFNDFGSPTFNADLNPNQSINSVGEIGKINDTVDISSEDLKVMRELAEMKSIQNFVTLTPTVQVTTGDINSGHDIDTIVARIEEKLEDEFVASAEGVYE